MNAHDPLTQLLRQWEPTCPRTPSSFTAEVMRQVRAVREESAGIRLLRVLAEFSEAWLPSPSVLVPASVAVLLALAGATWTSTRDEARSLAALRWQQQVTQPASPVSLAGALLVTPHDS